MPQSAFDKLSLNDQMHYQGIRQVSVDMTRYWEPSMDELTGLIAGYSFVHAVVADPAIQAEVADQVAQLARYLAANAFLLVRPEGGFCAQGGSGMAPAFEFPFGRVFSRITGSAHPAQTNFEGALQNAKLWSQFSTAFAVATVTGPLTGPLFLLLLSTLAPPLGELLGLIVTAAGGLSGFINIVGGGGIVKAGIVYANREAFDVRSWPGGPRDQQEEFVMAYLLAQFPPVQRFTTAVTALGLGIGKYAENFPPYLGLTALNDPDHTVRDSYLGWLAARRALGDATANSDQFASAVAVLLGSGQAEQEKLVSLLWQLATDFDGTRNDDLDVYDDASGYDGNITYVTEQVEPALDFMSGLALAWYYSKIQADAGNPLPTTLGFPAPPPAGTTFPAATVPAAVIQATSGLAPAQVIPLGALPPLPTPLPDEIDLFSASAPRKPADVPALTSPVRWLFSNPVSHYGNIFGDSGTDTINAGKTVTGSSCRILGVKLQLVDRHGVPLGDLGTTTTKYGGDAVVGSWPSTAGARMVPGVTYPATDETAVVQWWYDVGRACRYRIGYLVAGVNCGM
jgi:hypothetical protein